MKLTGAQIIIECLKQQGVEVVFGYPGGSVLNIYDALHESGEGIKHILTSHEQGASHAADAYARASGKTGVCMATSGPGATNLVTGIATAYMDSVPMVAITGQVPSALIGKDSFQEVDITGITEPITKHNYLVRDASELADVIRNAFAIAKAGRPGPVLIDICKDATAAIAEFDPNGKASYVYEPVKFDIEKLDTAVDALKKAQRPIILSGGGTTIAGVGELVKDLSNKLHIPVATTLMGTGSFDDCHPLATGLVGMHGTRTSNKAVSSSDLFIAIGARFSDRVTSNLKRFAPDAKIMHMDVDPAEIGKNIRVDYPVIGELKDILNEVINKVEQREETDWARQVKEWKVNHKNSIPEDGKLRPSFIIGKLCQMTNGDAVITTEVGQNQIWAAQYYDYCKPRRYISSGGLGTMGYGTGAAIGAQMAMPDKKVINIAGDGSFRMNCNELATAVYYKLPIIIAVLNNGTLGMVRQWQTMFYDKRYSQTTLDRGPDFVKLAFAFGAKGIKVTSPDEVEGAFKEALSSTDCPYVIEFKIDIDERVLPIVPPGKGIDQLIYA